MLIMLKCKTCKQWIQDHRFDLVLQIAKSCETLKRFDEAEKIIYPEYSQDNAVGYLEAMTDLHELTHEEVSFIYKY